jgi:hypothetical protein
VGYHTVSFSSISGWTTPASQTIVLGSKAIAAVSGVYTPEPFKFTINSDGVSLTITEYAGSATNLDIPTTLNGFRVSGIGNFAFRWCTNLINVNIGSSVTNIGFNPFLECDSLTAITVDPSNPAYSSIAGVLFDRTQTTLVSYPSHGPESYAIPSSVTSIGNFAFLFCAGVSNVIIGDSVTNIGRDAFAGCWLLNVTIGNHVTRIGERAFEYCIGLSNLAISDSVTSIGDLAFYGCYGLTNATFGTNVTSIGTNVFEGCDGLTSVTLPASLTNIGDFAFYQCNGLTNIVFDNCAARIGALAFADCSGLTSLTIPDSVISIGDSAFAACQALRNLTIGNGVNYIGSGAFFLCRSLTNVTIGNSVTTIGDNAFSDCYGLTNVFFQGNAPSVGSDWTVFSNDSTVTIYYLAGTSGWGDTFEGMPTALWTPTLTVQYVAPNVVLTWPSGVLIESTNLASAVWMTNAAAQSPYTVIPDGPQKFYRVKIN